MIKKIVFLFAWLGILFIAIFKIVDILSPEILVNYEGVLKVLHNNIFVVTVAVLYILICILKFISLFERTKDYEIKTENGVVYISSNTVTDFVQETLSQDKDLKNIKVKTIKKGKYFNIIVSLNILTNGDVASKTASLQTDLKYKINTKLGIEIGKIQMKISKLTVDNDQDEIVKEEEINS